MPVWVPINRSKDLIDWAAANNIPITPGGCRGRHARTRSAITRLPREAWPTRITPNHLNIQIDAYIADTREQAIAEYGPYVAYFHNVLFNFDHVRLSTVGGYFQKGATEHLRPELRATSHDDSIRARDLTVDDIVNAPRPPPGGRPTMSQARSSRRPSTPAPTRFWSA